MSGTRQTTKWQTNTTNFRLTVDTSQLKTFKCSMHLLFSFQSLNTKQCSCNFLIFFETLNFVVCCHYLFTCLACGNVFKATLPRGCCENSTRNKKREKTYKFELLEQEKEPTGAKQNRPEWKEEPTGTKKSKGKKQPTWNRYMMIFNKKEDSDIGNRTRGKHVRDAYVTNYTISEIIFLF